MLNVVVIVGLTVMEISERTANDYDDEAYGYGDSDDD